jgi:hypothetical protein
MASASKTTAVEASAATTMKAAPASSMASATLCECGICEQK